MVSESLYATTSGVDIPWVTIQESIRKDFKKRFLRKEFKKRFHKVLERNLERDSKAVLNEF